MKTVWEYLSVRFQTGIGLSQDFAALMVNGQFLKTWKSEGGQTARTLPDFLDLSGEDGWELVSHAVNLGIHDMQFKRPKTS